jgi:dTDP-4-amino-4,6-dideoxygalactose transaminase
MTSKAGMKVPGLDLRAQYREIRDEVQSAIATVFETQRFILGSDVHELEKEIAAYCGTAHAVACASGSDALLLALMALGVAPGDEVITTPFSFFATASAVVRLGATPVFVDIDPGTLNIDADLVAQALTARTKVILPVHLFGQCADLEPINKAASAHGIPVLEDAAQAIGAEYRGTKAGALGRVATFSFYPTKNLGGAGDGGMLTTSDPELADRLKLLRVHGARTKYFHDELGVNSRLDTLQAAILRVKLRHLEEWTSARRERAERYRTLFAESGLGSEASVILPVDAGSGRHVYNQFVVRARARDGLRDHLSAAGVGTEVYYPLPLHLQPCFSSLGYKIGDFPEAELASREVLALPIYPELTDEAQSYVVAMTARFYRA